jgi:hypothetical protein
MDRTNELLRAAQVYGQFSDAKTIGHAERSPYMNVALRVSQLLNSNEQHVGKLESL